MSPGMAGPSGWSCYSEQQERDWGGLDPVLVLFLVLCGVDEHHWVLQH